MPRITPTERKRFHKILDDSIDKLNSSKNRKKNHWKYQDIIYLALCQMEESEELHDEIFDDKPVHKNQKAIESECFYNINFPMMIIDNLRGNK